MKFSGKVIDFKEEEVSGGKFLKIIVVIEAQQEFYYRPKDRRYEDTKPIMFEYFTQNFLKKDERINKDDFYIYMKELESEASRHSEYTVDIDYSIKCQLSKNGDRYFQSLVINDIKGRAGQAEKQEEYSDLPPTDLGSGDGMGEFVEQEGDLPF